MHALIVYCHPEPRSFNGTLKDVAVTTLQRIGYTVEISDLYAENFDPAEGPQHYPSRADPDVFSALVEQRHGSTNGSLPDDVRREIARLERADLVVFQFPIWWHAQPGMLKGWLDRVFVNGKLYTSRMRYDRGYFRGRRAICSVTTGGPAETFAHNGRGGDIELLLWPMNYSLHYMGFEVLAPFRAHGIQGGGYAYRAQAEYLAELEAHKQGWAKRLEHLHEETPIAFAGWEDWDETGRLKPGVEGHDYFIRARP